MAVQVTTDNIDLGSDPKPPIIYRCKKCRRIVATEDQIVTHERGEGQKCFKWKRRNDGLDKDLPECSSIFVEPMKWMQSGLNLLPLAITHPLPLYAISLSAIS